jgi:hypothetical protein
MFILVLKESALLIAALQVLPKYRTLLFDTLYWAASASNKENIRPR